MPALAQVPDRGRGGVREAPLAVPLPTSPAPESPKVGREVSLEALEMNLGPVPKEIAVGEGTGLDALQRIAALPNTTVGFVLKGGNTLRPEDVSRLSRLRRVHLYLRAPILPVHLEVLRKVAARRVLTVIVPGERVPAADLARRLALAGPTEIEVRLEGEPTAARLAPLSGLRGSVLVRMPASGFSRAAVAALAALKGTALGVVVPAGATPRAVRTLSGAHVRRLLLETEDDRVSAEVADAAASLGVRTDVQLDGRLAAGDLARLKGVPHLGVIVWLGDRAEVPFALTDLVRRSEGEVVPRRR